MWYWLGEKKLTGRNRRESNPFRMLLVTKANKEDPGLDGLLRWMPRAVEAFRLFEFRRDERRRGETQSNLGLSKALLEEVEEFQPTHVLSWVPYLNPREVDWIKRRGISVAIALNGVTSFHCGLFTSQRRYFDMLACLDAYFIPHGPHVPVLREWGINAFEMPLFYDPDVFRPLPPWSCLWGFACADACFIGNIGAPETSSGKYRTAILREMSKRLTVRLVSDVRLSGDGLRWHSPIHQDWRLNWITNRSPLSLGSDYLVPEHLEIYNSASTDTVVEYDPSDTTYTIRARTYSAMGSGACYLVERHPEIERMFVDGKEIALWSDLEEAPILAEKLLHDEERRGAIAKSGLEKVRGAHTAEHRVRQILSQMSSPQVRNA